MIATQSTHLESEVGQKRKKLTGDERLSRNRERNRVHARKTRERKKNQTVALQSRINELFEEGNRLRQLVDERYTASSLLNLRDSHHINEGSEAIPIVPSSQICKNYYLQVLRENSWLRDGTSQSSVQSPSTEKRVRRSGKYTPQERERIRRERNRMHAKKTRDRKKFFLEMSEKIITEMEEESKSLRNYLLSLRMISEEECRNSRLREMQSKQELAHLKGNNSAEENDEDDSSDNEEGEEEEENELIQQAGREEREEPSVSGSEDTEKTSWNGSNDGSSNPDSGNGSTSADNTSSNGEVSTSKLFTLSYDQNNNHHGNRYPYKHTHTTNTSTTNTTTSHSNDDRDSPEYNNRNGASWSENGNGESDNSERIQEAESYHHGLKSDKNKASADGDSSDKESLDDNKAEFSSDNPSNIDTYKTSSYKNNNDRSDTSSTNHNNSTSSGDDVSSNDDDHYPTRSTKSQTTISSSSNSMVTKSLNSRNI